MASNLDYVKRCLEFILEVAQEVERPDVPNTPGGRLQSIANMAELALEEGGFDQVPGEDTRGPESPAEATDQDTGLLARVKALEAHTRELRGPRALSREGQAYQIRVEELTKALDPRAFHADPHAPLKALGGIVRELTGWLMDIDTGNLRHDDPDPVPEAMDTYEWQESRDAWLDKHYPRPATTEHKAARAAWDAARSEVSDTEVRAARLIGSARSLAEKTEKMMRFLDRNVLMTGLGNAHSEIKGIMSHCIEILKDPWPKPEKDWDEMIAEEEN